MASIDERIAQYENMAQADPENEMAHFSLGSAYLKAGRPAEAAVSLEKCVVDTIRSQLALGNITM